MYYWENKKDKTIPSHWTFGGSMGLLAGFTTMIGNLAGAFSNIYFLAMRLPKNNFIGTAAWLFFLINSFKVPFHIWSWETINSKSILVIHIFFTAKDTDQFINLVVIRFNVLVANGPVFS